jgi:glycosyltransferase involved in cell wall biosynthesis
VQGSPHVAVYVGGIYEHKRIPFLLAAADEIRELIPDFHLVVIGAGAQAQLVKDAAARHDWIHYMGPKFGDEKTELVRLAKAFLMPGLVGLAVLDAFAYGTPMVTTDLPYHSPEIDYLEDGVNGVIVRDSDDPAAYAKAVTRVLTDDAYRAQMQAGGQAAMATYTIENMAERFASGVVKALGS